MKLYVMVLNTSNPQLMTAAEPLTFSIDTGFLWKISWPIIARGIKNALESVVTEENLQKAQEELKDAVEWLTEKIPGDFDDILVDKLEELFTDSDFIAKYGAKILDPLEAFIIASENEYDDLLLPAIEQLRVIASIPYSEG